MKNISIIVPVYNTSKYLSECIDSIINQDYQSFELILINDGSTDNSGEICNKYAKKDSRIKVIHKRNGGQSSARNAGLDIAIGEYITFVDADDVLNLQTLNSNMDLLNKYNNIDIIQYPISKNRDSINKHIITNDLNTFFESTESLYKGWLVDKKITNYVCNKIFKKKIFSKLRFKEGMYYEDRYLMCDILATCRKMAISNNGCYFYRTHEQQTTQKRYSEYVLNSLITADLHIVESVRPYSSLNRIQIERYTNCLYFAKTIKKSNWILKENLLEKIKHLVPNPWVIFTAKSPIGLKMNCLLYYLFKTI